ncbi:MAG: chromate efflux transporter [Chloroflexi bacterium]|nr:chromate efflux transporter [Chloroflexota bacterium]
MTDIAPTRTAPRVSYAELARLFTRFSLTAFGGPVAHIAIAEDEIVARRGWLTREHYLDLVAATNLIPGPNSTEVMIHVGYVLRGIPGALLTGSCFILPSALLTLLLAVLYVNTGSLPQVEAILAGIKPVIVAIIASVGYRLVVTALKTPALWVLFALSILIMVFTDLPEVVVMLAAGALYGVYKTGIERAGTRSIASLLPLALPTVATAVPVSLWDIFWYFLRIGSVLFGSGYVLIVYIQQDLVDNFRWLTTQQLLDAIAIGQMTPGPVSTTVAVVGYILAGVPGAVAGTLGIFLPSFVLVILTAPLIPGMRRNPFWGAFLGGVNAGVIAAILITVVVLANAALHTANGAWSPLALALGLAALVLLIRFKVNATWLILAGGVVGFAAGAITV